MSYDRYKKIDKSRVIDTPNKAIKYVKNHATKARQRMLYCLYLSDDLQPCYFDALPDEMQNESSSAQRTILRTAVSLDVEQIVIVSIMCADQPYPGDPQQDQYELIEALTMAGINTLDHVVMQPLGFFEVAKSTLRTMRSSWKKAKLLPNLAA